MRAHQYDVISEKTRISKGVQSFVNASAASTAFSEFVKFKVRAQVDCYRSMTMTFAFQFQCVLAALAGKHLEDLSFEHPVGMHTLFADLEGCVLCRQSPELRALIN